MRPEFRVASSEVSGAVFSLIPDQESGSPGTYFRAQIVTTVLTADIEVWDWIIERLADYFRELEEHCRGWDGVRRWESVQDVLFFEATHDGRGHVSLRVEVRGGDNSEIVSCTLKLEAGQLAAIARAAERSFGSR